MALRFVYVNLFIKCKSKEEINYQKKQRKKEEIRCYLYKCILHNAFWEFWHAVEIYTYNISTPLIYFNFT